MIYCKSGIFFLFMGSPYACIPKADDSSRRSTDESSFSSSINLCSLEKTSVNVHLCHYIFYKNITNIFLLGYNINKKTKKNC